MLFFVLSVFSVLVWLSSFIVLLVSESIFTMWVSLELNLISFLVLISFSERNGAMISLKYFIIQAIASAAIIFIMVTSSLYSWAMQATWLIVALLLKSGIAPMHFWILNISKLISWEGFFLMMTVQKLLPLYILLNTLNHDLTFWASLGAVLGVMGVWSILEIKPILVYSSVVGASWMIGAQEFCLSGLFLLSYSLSFLVVSVAASASSMEVISNKVFLFSEGQSIFIFIAVMSMAGMPPFLGFFAKMALVNQMLGCAAYALCVLLIASSAFFIFIYARLCTSNLVKSFSESVTSVKPIYPSTLLLVVAMFIPIWVLIYMCKLEFESEVDKETYHT